ncbi:MAG: tetratricopeptide repeat protein [Pseudomonadota bacterium]
MKTLASVIQSNFPKRHVTFRCVISLIFLGLPLFSYAADRETNTALEFVPQQAHDFAQNEILKWISNLSANSTNGISRSENENIPVVFLSEESPWLKASEIRILHGRKPLIRTSIPTDQNGINKNSNNSNGRVTWLGEIPGQNFKTPTALTLWMAGTGVSQQITSSASSHILDPNLPIWIISLNSVNNRQTTEPASAKDALIKLSDTLTPELVAQGYSYRAFLLQNFGSSPSDLKNIDSYDAFLQRLQVNLPKPKVATSACETNAPELNFVFPSIEQNISATELDNKITQLKTDIQNTQQDIQAHTTALKSNQKTNITNPKTWPNISNSLNINKSKTTIKINACNLPSVQASDVVVAEQFLADAAGIQPFQPKIQSNEDQNMQRLIAWIFDHLGSGELHEKNQAEAQRLHAQLQGAWQADVTNYHQTHTTQLTQILNQQHLALAMHLDRALLIQTVTTELLNSTIETLEIIDRETLTAAQADWIQSRLMVWKISQNETLLTDGSATTLYADSPKARSNLAELEKWMRDNPNHVETPRWMYDIAKLHDLAGNHSRAMDILASLQEKFPLHSNAIEVEFRLAEDAYSLNKYVQAELGYQRILQNPNSSQDWKIKAGYMRAWSLLKQNKLKESENAFIALLENASSTSSDTSTNTTFDLKGLRQDTYKILALLSVTQPSTPPIWQQYPRWGWEVLNAAHSFALQDQDIAKAEWLLSEWYNIWNPNELAEVSKTNISKEQLGAMQIVWLNALKQTFVLPNEKTSLHEWVSSQNTGTFDHLDSQHREAWHTFQEKSWTALAYDAIRRKQWNQGWENIQRLQESAPDDIDTAFITANWIENLRRTPNNLQWSKDMIIGLGWLENYYSTHTHPTKDSKTLAAEAAYLALVIEQTNLFKSVKNTQQLQKISSAEAKELNAEDSKKFLQRANRVLKIYPNHPRRADIQQTSAQLAYQAGEYQTATLLADKLANDPKQQKTPEPLIILAETAAAQSNYSDAAYHYEHLIQKFPKHKDIEIWRNQFAVNLWQLIERDRATKNGSNISNHADRLYALAPDAPQTSAALHLSGLLALEQRNYQKAADTLTLFIKKYPNAPKFESARLGYAQALQQMDQTNPEQRRKTADAYIDIWQGYKNPADENAQKTLWTAINVLAPTVYDVSNMTASDLNTSRSWLNSYIKVEKGPSPNHLEALMRLDNLEKTANKSVSSSQGSRILKLYTEHFTSLPLTHQNWLLRYAQTQADISLAAFQQTPLKAPFESFLPKKRDTMQNALNAYQVFIALGAEHVITHPELKMRGEFGQAMVFESMAKALMESPRPSDLSEEEQITYGFLLEEQALPLEDKAISLYERVIAQETNTLSPSSTTASHSLIQQSLEQLRGLYPARYDRKERILDISPVIF